MSSFHKRLSLLMKGDLDKTLFVLLDKTCEDYIDEESFRKLLEVLDNKHPKYTRIEGLDNLLKSVREQSKWQGALKSLMVFHKLVHSIGGEFLQHYGPSKIANIAKFAVDKSSLKNLVHSAIVPNYYNYLQKLSYNYDDLKTCFSSRFDFTEKLNENKLSLLHLLSKVQNILLYLFKLFPLLEACFDKFQESPQIKQLCYFCLTDACYFYTYVNQLVTCMLREIFNLVESDAILLYELYSEHVKMTKQLASFFELKNHLSEFSFKLPEFYAMDVKFNREVELYILTLKKDISSISHQGNKTTTNASKPEIGSIELALGYAAEARRPSRKPLTAFNDVLRSLETTSVTMPNLKPTSKQLFKPPVIQKGKGNSQMIPQVKFYRADTEKEEEKGAEWSANEFRKATKMGYKMDSRKVGKDGNRNLDVYFQGETSLMSLGSDRSSRSASDSYIAG